MSNDIVLTGTHGWLGSRMLHAIVYIAGIAYIRTLFFAIGWLVCFYLLWQALTA